MWSRSRDAEERASSTLRSSTRSPCARSTRGWEAIPLERGRTAGARDFFAEILIRCSLRSPCRRAATLQEACAVAAVLRRTAHRRMWRRCSGACGSRRPLLAQSGFRRGASVFAANFSVVSAIRRPFPGMREDWSLGRAGIVGRCQAHVAIGGKFRSLALTAWR